MTDKPCQGMIFRAHVSTHETKRGFAKTFRLDHMKRLSCPGCEQCGWQSELISEAVGSCGCGIIIGIESVEDKELYSLRITNISKDWENGIVDNCDIELVPYNYKAKGE